MVKSDEELRNEYRLERFKFVLQQIDRSNENFKHYGTLYQTLGTAIIGAIGAVVIGWTKAGISAETATAVARGLEIVLALLASFVVLSMFAGVASWVDYRREETMILNKVMMSDYRELPRMRNFWRWHESYLILFVVVSALAVIGFLELRILPISLHP